MSEETFEVEAPVAEEVVADDVNVVTFDGEEYKISKDVMDDVEVLEAWEDGKHTLLLRAILGRTQWAVFKQKKRGLEEVYGLLAAVMKATEVE